MTVAFDPWLVSGAARRGLLAAVRRNRLMGVWCWIRQVGEVDARWQMGAQKFGRHLREFRVLGLPLGPADAHGQPVDTVHLTGLPLSLSRCDTSGQPPEDGGEHMEEHSMSIAHQPNARRLSSAPGGGREGSPVAPVRHLGQRPAWGTGRRRGETRRHGLPSAGPAPPLVRRGGGGVGTRRQPGAVTQREAPAKIPAARPSRPCRGTVPPCGALPREGPSRSAPPRPGVARGPPGRRDAVGRPGRHDPGGLCMDRQCGAPRASPALAGHRPDRPHRATPTEFCEGDSA